MNHKYIYNFYKIYESHKDISDYELFYSSYKIYIETNLNEHKAILEVLKKCLYKFKNMTLISIVYRLLFSLKIELNLDYNILKKHLRKKYLRKYIFPILPENFISDQKIKRWLYSKNYEEENFFRYIKNKHKIINNYLCNPNNESLRKQLLTILHTNIYTNLDLYMKFIGSKNKHIGFLVYEILCQIVNDECVLNFNDFIIKEGIIRLNKKLEIENIENFLLFFLCFMEEKHIVYNLLSHNINEVEILLKEKYLITKSKLNKIKNISYYTLDISKMKKCNRIFFDTNIDFDFLFNGKNYKTFSDCVEL